MSEQDSHTGFSLVPFGSRELALPETAQDCILGEMVEASLAQAQATVKLPIMYSERAVYVVAGAVESDGRSFQAGQMLVFAKGADAFVKALTPATLMALGGEPVGPRFIDWNFVSSSKQRIEQAKQDWRAGRMRLPDLDNQEFIALP